MSFTRSKRFITERLPVAPPLRLRELCLDILIEVQNSCARKLGGSFLFGKDEVHRFFKKALKITGDFSWNA